MEKCGRFFSWLMWIQTYKITSKTWSTSSCGLILVCSLQALHSGQWTQPLEFDRQSAQLLGGVHFKKNGSNGNCKMLVWMLILHVSLWFLTFLSLTHAMKMHESCVKSAGSPGVASDKAPSTTAFLGSAKPWWRWNFREHQLEVGFKTFCFCDTPKLLSEELLSNIYVASKSQAVKIESAKIILYQNTCSWTSSNSTWEVLEYWTNAS